MEEIGNIVNGIAARAAEIIKREEGDYIQDGLLYCGKCHTQKQCKIHLLERDAIVFCMCKCMQERQKEEDEQNKAIERMQRLEKLRRTGFPDSEMENWTFDADDGSNPKLTETARRYALNFDRMRENGKGLLLYGPVGTGKTFIAACIANFLINRGIPCMVSSVARIVSQANDTREMGKQEYLDSLSRFDLLVLDDLASERDTEYMAEMVQSVIDSRYRAHLPLIVTTNLTGEELKHPQDISKQRVYSRLFEMCLPIEVTGADRRKRKLTAEYEEYKNLLGL